MIKYWWLNALAFLLNSLLFIFILFPVCLWWANPQQCCPWKLLSVADVGQHSSLSPWVHPGCFSPVHQKAWRDWLMEAFFHTGCFVPVTTVRLQSCKVECVGIVKSTRPRGQSSGALFFSSPVTDAPIWSVHPEGTGEGHNWGWLLPHEALFMFVKKLSKQASTQTPTSVRWRQHWEHRFRGEEKFNTLTDEERKC